MIFVPHGKATPGLTFLAILENIPITVFRKSKVGHGVTQELKQCRTRLDLFGEDASGMHQEITRTLGRTTQKINTQLFKFYLTVVQGQVGKVPTLFFVSQTVLDKIDRLRKQFKRMVVLARIAKYTNMVQLQVEREKL